MLVINTKPGRRIRIGPKDNPLWITFLGFDHGNTINLGFDGPETILVIREEIIDGNGDRTPKEKH